MIARGRVVRALGVVLAGVVCLTAFGKDAPGWGTNLKKALRQARGQGKLVLLFVSDGTANSKKMLGILDQNPVVKDMVAKNFIRVMAKKGDNLAELRMLAPRMYPSTIVLTPTRRPVRQVDGVVSARKMAEQLTIALSQFEKSKIPVYRKPSAGRSSFSSQSAREVKTYPHTGACPVLCPTCGNVRAKALAYLAGSQEADGRWRRNKQIDENNAEAMDFIDVSLTALALIAFRAEGSTEKTGTYSAHIRKGMNWLANTARKDGDFCLRDSDEIIYQAHGHWHTALAMWALAESPDAATSPRYREVLGRAVRHFEQQQDPRGGGWGYGKFWKTFDRDTPLGLVNVGMTHLIVTALGLMNDQGITPLPGTMEKGQAFLKACRGPGGGYGYDPARRKFEYPGAAAGVLVTSRVLGQPLDEEWHRSNRFLRAHLADLGAFKPDECLNFFHLFAALALDMSHPDDFRDYWALYRDRFASEQNKDGSWDSSIGGKPYATAVRLAVMHLPRRNLRIQTYRVPPPDAGTFHEKHPRFLKTRGNLTQQKVFKLKKRFAPWEKYGLDLVVQIDDAHSKEQESMFRRLFEDAAVLFYDVTDGQFRMNTVTLAWRPVDRPDVLITRDTHPDIHGIARTMRKLVNGREVAVVERDVVLPLKSPAWKSPGGSGVVVHELSHYYFGMPDEYALDTRRAYCPGCMMAGSWHGASEYCTKATHQDKRHALSCWELMKALYPLVEIPRVADPGPHLCPGPVISVVR